MYWEPHTSSIEFCETNYIQSYYITEVHNSWSSIIGISLLGLLGLKQASASSIISIKSTKSKLNHPLGEDRVKLYLAVLTTIGIGSTALHSTLRAIFQATDELPMLYLIFSMFYQCVEIDAEPGNPNNPNLDRYMFLLAAISTAVYYSSRHIFIVFFIIFNVSLLITGSRLLALCKESKKVEVKQARNIGIIFYFAIGVPCWIFDMIFCEHYVRYVSDNLLPGVLKGITPHVIWHICAGLGSYFIYSILVMLRCEKLHKPLSVRWFGGILLPILSVPSS